MRQPLIHTIRIHTGTDAHGYGLVTVVHGTNRTQVTAEAQAIPGATLYEVEEWDSATRCKSRRTVTTLDQRPGQALDQRPGQALDQRPGQALDQRPGQALDQRPGQALEA